MIRATIVTVFTIAHHSTVLKLLPKEAILAIVIVDLFAIAGTKI